MRDEAPGPGRRLGGGGTGGAVPGDVTRKTYRYLRVSVVGLGLLLGVSLVLEMLRADGERFGSISGYYYSPVRSILVGALVAIGPILVSIKGRAGWEDTLLDLAGMLAPVVALVPAPLPVTHPGVECPPGVDRCIPPEFVPSVENNIVALAVLGAAALLFAWWSAGTEGRRDPSTRWGILAAIVTWAVFVGSFLAARDLFLTVAHYGAAIPFFVVIAAVAHLNGRRVPSRRNLAVLRPGDYARAYRVVGALMVVTVLLTGAYYGVSALAGAEPWDRTVLAVEATLLLLFIVFWTLQTAENWREEAVSEEVRPAGADSPPAR